MTARDIIESDEVKTSCGACSQFDWQLCTHMRMLTYGLNDAHALTYICKRKI